MSHQKIPNDGNAQFAIAGELTIFRATELRNAILAQINHTDVLEIDLSQVTEIDSAGLQLLVSAKLEALIRDKQLHFTGHSEPVLDVFDLCDLGGFFGDQVVIAPHTAH